MDADPDFCYTDFDYVGVGNLNPCVVQRSTVMHLILESACDSGLETLGAQYRSLGFNSYSRWLPRMVAFENQCPVYYKTKARWAHASMPYKLDQLDATT